MIKRLDKTLYLSIQCARQSYFIFR